MNEKKYFRTKKGKLDNIVSMIVGFLEKKVFWSVIGYKGLSVFVSMCAKCVCVSVPNLGLALTQASLITHTTLTSLFYS